MLALLRCKARGFLLSILDRLSTAQLESLIYHLVVRRVAALLPSDALRFLFRLDAAFYTLEGQQSVAYGGGLHTKHRHIRYHDFFVNRIRAGEQVLDIGCGNGALSYDVAEKAGANVVGIDLDVNNIAFARDRYAHPRIEYRVGDALQDLPGDHFDVVILSNILEHLQNRPQFLRQVWKKVQPTRILIRVPLLERDWRIPLRQELSVEWRLDNTHETEYTMESWAEEIKEAEFTVIHQEIRWGEIWAEVAPDDS